MTTVSRRTLLRGSLAAGLAAPALLAAGPARAAGPIVKPLPPELFTVFGTNAETRWEALRDTGYHTPIDRFFVRNHTATPLIDHRTWRLEVHGSGVRRPLRLSYAELRALPAREVSAFIECTGNGRSFFTTQQGQSVKGTAWKLGAVGVARWRGVPLSRVLDLAGVRREAVDVMPVGLDAEWVDGAVNRGHVRRPLPIAKALDDVLLAYEMNGEPLPPDHGFPVRVVVPSWVGIASIKWVGSIEVSDEPLSSPWDTDYYRLFGPGHPPQGTAALTQQVVKSAFELPFPATVPAGPQELTGRSWSGGGRIRHVEVSTDGATWRRAIPHGAAGRDGWLRWRVPWRPVPGAYELRARAVDERGHTQPEQTEFNTLGYLFDAQVRHPVTVV